VAHTCDYNYSATTEVEAGGLEFQASLGKDSEDLSQTQNKIKIKSWI
jgi:hypothetical protein